ncbi:hypothetical protein NW754_008476 [Fusarium falciforme]|nr:hypothetical protein NW754_008476 [Fusarium falciforme]
MPPRARAKPASALAGLVGSDTEPDLDAFDEAEIQAARTMSATKKPRGRPPRTANKVTKTTASSTRRGSGMLSAVPESATRPSTTTKTNSGMAGAGAKPNKTSRMRPSHSTISRRSRVSRRQSRKKGHAVDLEAYLPQPRKMPTTIRQCWSHQAQQNDEADRPDKPW